MFPYYAVFDRSAGTAHLELGRATVLGGPDSVGPAIAVTVAVTFSLFASLLYLVYLRQARISAEEWLKANEHVLFSHAKSIKSPEDIL